MADYRAIMRLLVQGRSYHEITSSLNCSRRAISLASKALAERGITTLPRSRRSPTTTWAICSRTGARPGPKAMSFRTSNRCSDG